MSPGDSEGEDQQVGLCARCDHARVQPTRRGSAFWRCLRADSDPSFKQYPPLPVRECLGFEPKAEVQSRP